MGLFGVHDDDELGEKSVPASHAGGYATVDDVEITAIADIDEEKLERFGNAWNVPPSSRYRDHCEMLETNEFDIVSVCTPTILHHEHVVDAATKGDPDVIWCEKPIASSVTEAKQMIDTCDETDTELVINHSHRFTEKLQTLHDLMNERDLLGDVHSVHAQFRMELMRNSTHLLDTLVYLLNSRADMITGYVNGENEAVDTLDVDDPVDDAGGGGFLVTKENTFATLDCTVPRESSSMCYIFMGSKGKLYLNNDDGEWRYWRLEDGEHIEESLPGIDGAWTWDEDYRNAFGNAAEHVVELVEGSAENLSSGREALKSLEIIIALYVTHHSGGRLDFPLSPASGHSNQVLVEHPLVVSSHRSLCRSLHTGSPDCIRSGECTVTNATP
ncbi:Gfo/Idh/MocA family oxidoreductase [Haloplanus pelagicus]|uniref:Gfo/Idh/MocA family protein n=1 Tax=Haloplanus pelagicus TaxID=2949995 RepID=UPI0031F30475